MVKQILAHDDIKVEKHKFHLYKSPFSIYDINIDRIVVPSKFPFSKKKVLNLL